MYWTENNVLSWVDLIQSGISLQYTPLSPVFKVSGQFTHTIRKTYISQVCNQKYIKYDPTLDLKNVVAIRFEILSSNFCPDCRDLIYLRYIDSKVDGKL